MSNLLSWTLLMLTASGPLLAHPITDSAEDAYAGPVLPEQGHTASRDDLSLADQAYLSQTGSSLAYPLLLAEEGVRPAGFLPRETVKEILLGKGSRLNPLSRVLASRKQYRKRGNASECFWKYCV